MLLSRFLDLDSALEVRSLVQRAADDAVALQLIAAHPWGVGLGSYLHAARQLWPGARIVHNVPLLVTAELGWVGGLFWLALALAPLAVVVRERGPARRRPLAVLPAWVAGLIIGLFHSVPWISTSWRTAILLGLLAGLLGAGKQGAGPKRSGAQVS
jgi:O-antigen ligase